jgi:hypothetical protein
MSLGYQRLMVTPEIAHLHFFYRDKTMNTPKKKIEPIPEGGPTFPLCESIAIELGDVPPNTPVTLAMFQRCLFRLADIRAGKVHDPKPKPKLKPWKDEKNNV